MGALERKQREKFPRLTHGQGGDRALMPVFGRDPFRAFSGLSKPPAGHCPLMGGMAQPGEGQGEGSRQCSPPVLTEPSEVRGGYGFAGRETEAQKG